MIHTLTRRINSLEQKIPESPTSIDKRIKDIEDRLAALASEPQLPSTSVPAEQEPEVDPLDDIVITRAEEAPQQKKKVIRKKT